VQRADRRAEGRWTCRGEIDRRHIQSWELRPKMGVPDLRRTNRTIPLHCFLALHSRFTCSESRPESILNRVPESRLNRLL
jgi:hypothetical protein